MFSTEWRSLRSAKGNLYRSKLRQHVSHHRITVFFAAASPGRRVPIASHGPIRRLFAIQWRWNKLMRKAPLLVALLGINLLMRAASVYTDRIDDPSAVYLTQSAFGVHADG